MMMIFPQTPLRRTSTPLPVPLAGNINRPTRPGQPRGVWWAAK